MAIFVDIEPGLLELFENVIGVRFFLRHSVYSDSVREHAWYVVHKQCFLISNCILYQIVREHEVNLAIFFLNFSKLINCGSN